MPPKLKNSEFSDLSKMPFIRNMIMATLLTMSTGATVDANASPKIDKNDKIEKLLNIKEESEKEKCTFTGGLRINDKAIELETLCMQSNKLIIRTSTLKPNVKEQYKIPFSKDAYFIIIDNVPSISFVKNGVRCGGLMPEDKSGSYSFEQYLEYIY